MATIGSIDLAMKISTTKLEKGLNAASKQLSSFASGLVGIAALAGTAFGAEKIGSFVIDSIKGVDALSDMASQIGTTSDRLSELRYTAQLTGSEADNLDGSLQKMTQVLGDAARDGGPAAKTLSKLGLSADSLIKMDPADSFGAIASAISTIQNPALQASVAVDLFGRSGVNLLNTLRAGPEEFERLRKEAQKFGLSLGPDAADKIAKANDAMDRLGFAGKGLGNVLAVELAPALTSTVGSLTEMVPNIISGIRVAGEWSRVILDDAVAVYEWADSLVDFQSLFSTVSQVVWDGFETIDTAVNNLGIMWELICLKTEEFAGNVQAVIETIPENFGRMTDYISNNWLALIKDLDAAWTRLQINIVKNMFGGAKSLVDLFQGKGFQLELTPLLDGFEATADALPELLAPRLVDISDRWEEVTSRLVDSRIGQLGERMERNKKTPAPPGERKPYDGLDKGVKGVQLAGIAELGSKEAYSAIVKYQASGLKDAPLVKVARNSEQTVQELRNLNKTVSRKQGGPETPVYRMS